MVGMILPSVNKIGYVLTGLFWLAGLVMAIIGHDTRPAPGAFILLTLLSLPVLWS